MGKAGEKTVDESQGPSHRSPKWWHCDTHGPGSVSAWGCPTCVREMREELQQLRARQRACESMDEAQKLALIRALMECGSALGLVDPSPAQVVSAVQALSARGVHLEQLAREVVELADDGDLPDGDGANTPTVLWAESWRQTLGRTDAGGSPREAG